MKPYYTENLDKEKEKEQELNLFENDDFLKN